MSLFLIGPSGVGKSTLKDRLIKDFPNRFEESISCTTRKPRPGEVDGEHYYFISEEKFKANVLNNLFLEWEEVHSRMYGTLISEVTRIQNAGRIPVFDIDLKGANSLLTKLNEPKEHVIFILPENMEELKTRLRKRSSETEDQINLRLKHAEWEISQSPQFPNKIINKDLDQTFQEIIKILKTQYVF